MIRKNFSFAAVAAALLVSGTAFAADTQPAAGAFPLFQPQNVVVNQAQRADVQAQAMAQAPEVGNMPVAQGTVDSSLTRAQVREATREAIARGFRPISGELS